MIVFFLNSQALTLIVKLANTCPYMPWLAKFLFCRVMSAPSYLIYFRLLTRILRYRLKPRRSFKHCSRWGGNLLVIVFFLRRWFAPVLFDVGHALLDPFAIISNDVHRCFGPMHDGAVPMSLIEPRNWRITCWSKLRFTEVFRHPLLLLLLRRLFCILVKDPLTKTLNHFHLILREPLLFRKIARYESSL